MIRRAGAALLGAMLLGACGTEVGTTAGPSTTTPPRPSTAVPPDSVTTAVPPTIQPPATTTTTTTTTPPPTTTTTPPTTAPPTTVPPTTSPPTTSPPTTSPPTTAPAPEVLERGHEGEQVRQLQERLEALRFWVGPVDGVYGWLTEQAVFAFQKANGLAVDGRVGPATRSALADPSVPVPRSAEGRVTEIDKSKQLLFTVVDGRLEWVFHTSTGTEQPYSHPAGYTALADTPPGTHTVFTQTDGWEEGRLGPMYRPKYFHHDGIAVHGYEDVPPYPASHGCVRVTLPAIDYIWANGLIPLESTVLVYGQTPPPGPAT